MITKFWLIIKDDAKRTYEILEPESNTNYFTNNLVGMQRAGMTVSGMTPPVTNAGRNSVRFPGYKEEIGLYDRLQAEYLRITRSEFDEWNLGS